MYVYEGACVDGSGGGGGGSVDVCARECECA